MFALLLFLTSFSVLAEDAGFFSGDEALSLYSSGYSYYTFMSNEDFAESNGRVALNLSASLKDVAVVSSQLSTHPLSPVQRLEVMVPFSVADRHQGGIKVGRFNKFGGFFSQILESPASMGVRYLPQTVYDERYVASLANFDGIQFFNTTFAESGDYRVKGTLSIGKPMMSKQEDIQRLMLDTTALADDIELVGDYNSYAAGLNVNLVEMFEFFMEYTTYNAHFERVSKGETALEEGAAAAILATDDPWLRTIRGGLKLSPSADFSVMGEFYVSNFSNPLIDGSAWCLMGDWSISDDTRLFAGYGENQSDIKGIWANTDTVIGVSSDYGDYFAGVEFHKTTGASLTQSRQDENTFGITVGYSW